MKRNGPPVSGPSAERESEAVGELLLTRSDQGPATQPVSAARPITPTPPVAALARLEIVLKPRGRGRFDAFFAGAKIVAASEQAITEAARVLSRRGYADEFLLVARHEGADHDAIYGPLGVWRSLRVREDRGVPRFVPWEPFPSRRVRGKERDIEARGSGDTPDSYRSPSKPPGAESTTLPLVEAQAQPVEQGDVRGVERPSARLPLTGPSETVS